MLGKITRGVALGGIFLAGLLTAGCATTTQNGPYSLTGVTSEQEHKEMLRYTDDKGHYRPDLRNEDRPGPY